MRDPEKRAAEVFRHDITVSHPDSYGLFACSGICFNLESPRRGMAIVTVTRKVGNGWSALKLVSERLTVGSRSRHSHR